MNTDEIPGPSTRRLALSNRQALRYRLNILQHPERVRCCGFGEKDRRPLDPPPIIELIAEDMNGVRIHLGPSDTILLVAHCELFSPDKQTNQTLVYTPWTTQALKESKASTKKPEHIRNLIGATISHVYHLNNESNIPGTYFIFHDLSVRTEGIFTLKFSFVNIIDSQDDIRNQLPMRSTSQEEVFTQPFSVYSAKKFPGLTISTALSRCFSKQGIKIPVRNDAFRRNSERTTTNTTTTPTTTTVSSPTITTMASPTITTVSSSFLPPSTTTTIASSPFLPPSTTTTSTTTTTTTNYTTAAIPAPSYMSTVDTTTITEIETPEQENITTVQPERILRYTRLPISALLLPEE